MVLNFKAEHTRFIESNKLIFVQYNHYDEYFCILTENHAQSIRYTLRIQNENKNVHNSLFQEVGLHDGHVCRF